MLALLRRDSTNPNTLASHRWWETAFPGHPYGRESKGTLETVPRITADDMRDYVRRAFARNELTISIVGDIDAKTAGALIDRAFAGLPAKNDLKPVAARQPARARPPHRHQSRRAAGGGHLRRARALPARIPISWPAISSITFWAAARFSSRLYREVREKRGLAYGVSDSLVWFRRAAVVLGGTATRADRTGDALAIVEAETKRMAENGPTADELAAAKSFLKGSYALTLDTSPKIAGQLTQIQLDNLGIDYIQRRGAMIDAVTIEDAKRVAKRLYSGGMLVTVAGRPKGLTSSDRVTPLRAVHVKRQIRPAAMAIVQSIDSALEKNIGPHGVTDKALTAALDRAGAALDWLRARHADGSLPLLRLPGTP